jgi:molybdopterin-guanine dinucleotide biosynthesis protein A
MLAPSEQAVAMRIGGRPQPLCAAYRRPDALAALDAMMAAGETRLRELLDRLLTHWVGEAELRALDPELASFFNLNTAEDYARARTMPDRLKPG